LNDHGRKAGGVRLGGLAAKVEEEDQAEAVREMDWIEMLPRGWELQNPNAECRMANEAQSPKDESRPESPRLSDFDIRFSFVIRHSDFVIN